MVAQRKTREEKTMSRFEVEIQETVVYRLTIEAEDAEAAEDAARAEFLDSDNPNQWFDSIIQRDYIAEEVTE